MATTKKVAEPSPPVQADPAQAYADEGAEKGYVRVQHDDSPPKGVEPGNEQTALLAALERGYHGEQDDKTPNEDYTVAGVTRDH